MNPQVLSSQTFLPITFLASILIWLMFTGLLVLWVVDGRIKREQALHAFVAVLLAWVVTQMIKSLYPTPRPFELNGGPIFTISTYYASGAFPSTHSAVAFALAVTIWLHDRKVGLLFLISAVAVGLGRIYSNVHFPIDILGGAAIGGLIALVVNKLHVYPLLKKITNT